MKATSRTRWFKSQCLCNISCVYFINDKSELRHQCQRWSDEPQKRPAVNVQLLRPAPHRSAGQENTNILVMSKPQKRKQLLCVHVAEAVQRSSSFHRVLKSRIGRRIAVDPKRKPQNFGRRPLSPPAEGKSAAVFCFGRKETNFMMNLRCFLLPEWSSNTMRMFFQSAPDFASALSTKIEAAWIAVEW